MPSRLMESSSKVKHCLFSHTSTVSLRNSRAETDKNNNPISAIDRLARGDFRPTIDTRQNGRVRKVSIPRDDTTRDRRLFARRGCRKPKRSQREEVEGPRIRSNETTDDMM